LVYPHPAEQPILSTLKCIQEYPKAPKHSTPKHKQHQVEIPLSLQFVSSSVSKLSNPKPTTQRESIPSQQTPSKCTRTIPHPSPLQQLPLSAALRCALLSVLPPPPAS
uniref:Uncharacterized protein n=1 Tax=Aegilops tauschii subsp. strangulata TaxID=200361 RepID=A0A452XTM4_AEGTS